MKKKLGNGVEGLGVMWEAKSIVMEKVRSQKLLRNIGADNGELEKA